MTIIRVSHQKNYTCISNQSIRDNRLSFKARGLHHLLLSYPDGWVINRDHLSSDEISTKDGRTAVASALLELEELGYLVRTRTRNENGQITGWESILYEIPPVVPDDLTNCQENRLSENPISVKPTDGLSASVKTDCQENRLSGNPSDGLTEIGKPDYILSTNSHELIKELNTKPVHTEQTAVCGNFDSNPNTPTPHPPDQSLSQSPKPQTLPQPDNSVIEVKITPRSSAILEQTNYRTTEQNIKRSEGMLRGEYPEWRVGTGSNDFNPVLLEYLVSEVMSVWSQYKGRKPTTRAACEHLRKQERFCGTEGEEKIAEYMAEALVWERKKTAAQIAVKPSDFDKWQPHQHDCTYRQQYRKSATLDEFYGLSRLNREWLIYAQAKFPDLNWDKK